MSGETEGGSPYSYREAIPDSNDPAQQKFVVMHRAIAAALTASGLPEKFTEELLELSGKQVNEATNFIVGKSFEERPEHHVGFGLFNTLGALEAVLCVIGVYSNMLGTLLAQQAAAKVLQSPDMPISAAVGKLTEFVKSSAEEAAIATAQSALQLMLPMYLSLKVKQEELRTEIQNPKTKAQ